jgi:putative ABC transport system substrate-binding protein
VTIIVASLHFAEAQQSKKIFRIGLLSGLRSSPLPPTTEALRQGLRELGYIEGQNIKIDYRWPKATTTVLQV